MYPIFFKVTMTVDGTYNEKWTTSGTFSMLSSNKVFIGGSNQPYKLPGANSKANFVGCMKKVGIFLDFVSFLPTMRGKKRAFDERSRLDLDKLHKPRLY